MSGLSMARRAHIAADVRARVAAENAEDQLAAVTAYHDAVATFGVASRAADALMPAYRAALRPVAS